MEGYLTHEEAIHRSKHIAPGVKYELMLQLDSASEFKGLIKIEFQTETLGDGLFLDFRNGQLLRYELNGAVLADSESKVGDYYTGSRILIPQSKLVPGANTIVISYANVYSQNFKGLSKYTDSDGLVYLFTESESCFASKIYPAFDQPDLKAFMKFHFIVPCSWTVVANTSLDNDQSPKPQASDPGKASTLFEETKSEIILTELMDGSKRYLKFQETKLLPCYLFAFCAGEYVKAATPELYHHRIPMDFYSVKSQAALLQSQLPYIVPYANLSFDFYEELFEMEYPFAKCDFVFCPEFRGGAMENPGLITMNSRNIFDTLRSTGSFTSRGRLIAHEIAHMWYGDLVTMKWWNDLWLKESLADYLSFLCLEHIQPKLPFPTQDARSNIMIYKNWGYNCDMDKDHTRAMSCSVPHCGEAENVFDGIVYCKGATVIQQLEFVLGQTALREILKAFLGKYAWKAATLSDFVATAESLCVGMLPKGFDLWEWTAEWIQAPNLNQVEVSVNSSEDGAPVVRLEQRPYINSHSQLRDHKIKIAFFDLQGDIDLVESVQLSKSKDCSAMLPHGYRFNAALPNYQDQSFIKVKLDSTSQNFFEEKIHLIQDRRAVLSIFRILAHDYKDGSLPPERLVAITLSYLTESSSIDVSVIDILGHPLLLAAFNKLLENQHKRPPSQKYIDQVIKLFSSLYQDSLAGKFDNADNYKIYKKTLSRLAKHYLRKVNNETFGTLCDFIKAIWLSEWIHQNVKELLIRKVSKIRPGIYKRIGDIDLSTACDHRAARCQALLHIANSKDIQPERFRKLLRSVFFFEGVGLMAAQLKDAYSEGLVGLLESGNHELLEIYINEGEIYFVEDKNLKSRLCEVFDKAPGSLQAIKQKFLEGFSPANQ